MTTPIRRRIEVLTQRGALKLAARSDAVALADADSVREIIDQLPDLHVMPLVDGPQWEVMLLWSRDRTLTPAQVKARERIAQGFADAAG